MTYARKDFRDLLNTHMWKLMKAIDGDKINIKPVRNLPPDTLVRVDRGISKKICKDHFRVISEIINNHTVGFRNNDYHGRRVSYLYTPAISIHIYIVHDRNTRKPHVFMTPTSILSLYNNCPRELPVTNYH